MVFSSYLCIGIPTRNIPGLRYSCSPNRPSSATSHRLLAPATSCCRVTIYGAEVPGLVSTYYHSLDANDNYPSARERLRGRGVGAPPQAQHLSSSAGRTLGFWESRAICISPDMFTDMFVPLFDLHLEALIAILNPPAHPPHPPSAAPTPSRKLTAVNNQQRPIAIRHQPTFTRFLP